MKVGHDESTNTLCQYFSSAGKFESFSLVASARNDRPYSVSKKLKSLCFGVVAVWFLCISEEHQIRGPLENTAGHSVLLMRHKASCVSRLFVYWVLF